MENREDYLNWCKKRAINELEHSGAGAAVASMVSDLGKWEGGEVYSPDTLTMLGNMGLMEAMSGGNMGVRKWIQGFR